MNTADNWSGDLAKFLEDYSYQPVLTPILDDINPNETIDQSRINEIVLWKVNRYAPISPAGVAMLNSLSALAGGSHRHAEAVLSKLLRERGVDLPMASTLLRFRNPAVFQIIDRHAYRALYGEDYPLYSQASPIRKIDIYFKYLDDLIALAKAKGLRFSDMDRVLYEFDRKINGSLTWIEP